MKKHKDTMIISFTGFSGSGKTTFIEKLIPELKKRNLNIGLIKHDAHEFQIDKEGKDSYRYRAAGADAVGIFSRSQMAVYGGNEIFLPEGFRALMEDAEDAGAVFQKTGTAAEEIINLMPDGLDLIILEGCRDSNIPKIGVSRVENGKGMSLDAGELTAVITDDPSVEHKYKFGLEDVSKVADFILQGAFRQAAGCDAAACPDYPEGVTVQQGLGILDCVPVMSETEKCGIYDVIGRVICEDIKAEQDFPPFRRSPLDGYAFHSEDTRGASPESPAILKVIAEIPAGHFFDGLLPAGCAVRLMTGAPIPDGADAVEKYEFCEFTSEQVKIFSEFRPDTNIVPKGEDYHAGDVLIARGTRLDPFCVSVLAMLGRTEISVFRKPVVALISTGTELVPAQAAVLGPGQIRSSSVFTIGGIAESEGAEAIDMGIVSDEAETIAAAVKNAADFADIIITTGGVSAGDYDLVVAALKAIGAHILFHKVKMKPGMAFATAQYNGKIILGLSGNPSAAAATMDVFGRAMIRKFLGNESMNTDTVRVKLMECIRKKSPMGRYIRGRLVIKDGEAYIKASPVSANGVTSANCGMDLLGIIPPGGADENSLIEAIVLKV